MCFQEGVFLSLRNPDGYLMTPFSYVGVQYLGERREFKVVGVTKTDNVESSSSRELIQDLSKLNLSGSGALEGGSGDINAPTSDVDIYKVTARTKLKIITESLGDGPETLRQHSPNFSDVGGLEKQVKLLKELVLHPLNSVNQNGKY